MNRHVIVVGAGIIGSACAAALTIAGQKVTIIDRLNPGEACSFGNAGGLSPGISFPLATPSMYRHIPGWLLDANGPLVLAWRRIPPATPWLVRFLREGTKARSTLAANGMRQMMRNAFEDYAPLVRFAGAELLIHRVGQLYVYSTDRAFDEDRSAINERRSLGLEQEILDRAAIRAYEPELSDRFKHGIYFPTHGHCSNPSGFVKKLVNASAENGARWIRAEVVDVTTTTQGVNVRTVDATYSGDYVVLAGGIWSNSLLSRFGTTVPLESHRGYHVQFKDAGVSPTRNVQWMEKKTLVTPMDDGLRVAGTAEIAGLEPPPTRKRFRLLTDTVKAIYPRVNVDSQTEWMGHRPCTPDSLPVLGPVPHATRILCAFGHGHVGLTSASFTSRIITKLVLEGDTADEADAFSIARFYKRNS